MGDTNTFVPEGIYALANPSSGITALNMNGECNLFGRKTYFNMTSFESFAIINDAPVEKEVVKEKEGSWWGNLITGIVATVALAACAVAVVATGGAALGAIMLAGAAVGAGIVTTSVAITDAKSGQARSWTQFLEDLITGAGMGAVAGATIYGLWTALPIVGQATGIQVSMWLGGVSKFTAIIVPKIVTGVGYSLMGLQGARYLNEITSIGTGQNWILENIFGGNQDNYATASMCLDLLSMGYLQIAADNAGLAKPKRTKNEFDYVDGELEDIPAEIWDDGPVVRGDAIDNSKELKNNLGHNFPTADSLNNRVLSSTKSYDILGKTYQNANKWLAKLKQDINVLKNFTQKTWNGVRIDQSMYDSKCLNVVLPRQPLTSEQRVALEQAKEYARNLGIDIKVYITK